MLKIICNEQLTSFNLVLKSEQVKILLLLNFLNISSSVTRYIIYVHYNFDKTVSEGNIRIKRVCGKKIQNEFFIVSKRSIKKK